ncbi:hypothetical protein AAFN85_11210 [Mucilaginibacter sp. CAU 1740]|uniref:hypothetical protein n=1 Tax=Mucilaginibacter sp. CAU 1740 TaxID=3140365 RepID=UPI00325C2F00
MTALMVSAVALLVLGLVLIFGILFFSVVKHIQRKYYPSWKFPDYVSVGYAEYLFRKFVKRDLPK